LELIEWSLSSTPKRTASLQSKYRFHEMVTLIRLRSTVQPYQALSQKHIGPMRMAG